VIRVVGAGVGDVIEDFLAREAVAVCYCQAADWSVGLLDLNNFIVELVLT
jgi:hypothetical protein